MLLAREIPCDPPETLALRESEGRLRAMANAVHDAVVIIDPEGNTSFWNRAAESIFGYRAEEVMGKNLHRLIAPERMLRLHEKGFAAFRQTGTGSAIGKTIELPARRKNGEEFPIELSLSAIRLKGRWHAVGILRDISKRKMQESELRAARNRVENADRARSDFLANISHEIRTPMNGILGMLRFLRESPLNEQQRQWADMAFVSAESLLALIHDILDFSKFKSGIIKLEKTSFHLPELVEGVFLLLKQSAVEKGIDYSMTIDPEVPLAWMGDPNHIRQVLVNLLGNAVKFTHQGSVRITVQGEPKDPLRWDLRIAIVDTGIGIPKNKIEHLFDPFIQVDGSMTRKYGGAGLGLAICRKLTDAMNGEIWVESKEGVGSTFTVLLPLVPSQDGERETPHENEKEKTSESPLNATILLVEDSHVNQMVAQEILRRIGCRAEIACNGQEALDRLGQSSFDAVLMDCQMPVMDGYEATREIRRREGDRRHTPIIAMTAHALEEARENCMRAGMDDYISKPVDPKGLYRVLNKWVQKRAVSAAAVSVREDSKTEEGCLAIFELDRLIKAVGKNVTLIQKILIAFLNDAPVRIGELEEGLSVQNAEQVRHAAHTLKGAAANIGAERLRQASYDIETLARQRQLEAVSGKVAGLRQNYQELKQTIKKIDWNSGIAG